MPKTSKPNKANKGVTAPRPVAVPPPAPPQAEGSYRDYPVLGSLPDLLSQYRDLQLRIAAVEPLEKQRKELGQSIEALLLAAGAKTVTAGALQVTRVETAGRKSISADRLVALGVPADTVVAATVTGAPSSYVRVSHIDADMKDVRQNGHPHSHVA